ncbi:MAG: TonB-dependent receptor [Acidobacteria bacterium]|nr:MAG: TonB-dependent receptor [Acidobacteriota bacterium]PYX44410.1 MAG: TonB-dependent receptor [Acidobacteriota bacterium]
MQLATFREGISNGSNFFGSMQQPDTRCVRRSSRIVTICYAGVALLVLGAVCFAGVSASISGTVRDPSGAAVTGANVTASNTDTGISQSQKTNSAGFYSFQTLPLGHYEVSVQQSGFKGYKKTGLVLDVDAALVVDVALQVGEVRELVQVQSEATHVETASSQLGEVIEGDRITTVPLVTRSYTDLLALQPGVVSSASGMSGAYGGIFNSAGFAVPKVSGDLSSGALSVNGQREANNGFLLNGATVQESGYGGTTAIPNLDSIAEFRILTNNYDAEYGNYSGGQINVITKGGTNRVHGNAFEFLRNTALNTRNYFAPPGTIGAYHQNQFGGTIGGPVIKDRIFFFADYQGNRKVVGESSPLVAVPTPTEVNGDFSAIGSQLAGTVTGPTWASQLGTALGHTVTEGEPYFFAGCSSSNCVFPNAQIPTSLFSPISKNLLAYIPTSSSGSFTTTSVSDHLRDDKTSGRIDANTGVGLFSVYYLFDNYKLSTPYPTANVPGFDAAGTGRTQNINLGNTRTFGGSTVNEARVAFTRVNNSLNLPKGGKNVTLSGLGFTTGGNGIVPLDPSVEGVPEIDFGSGLIIGVPSRPNRLIENTFQLLDNFSRVIGTHSVKMGANFHYNQLVEQLHNVLDGNFVFLGSETGSDFADFLLGAPTNYVQGQAEPSNGRSKYFGAYAQDSWRAKSNLTLNYGLRWDVSTPWSEQHNQIETIVPGLQSRVFPGSPTGWVFPGDPGIPASLAPTRYNNFGPRLGVAYSPDAKTSVRAGYGVFFTAFEGSTNFNEIGDAPFGFFWVGTAPSFSTPFINRTDGGLQGGTGQKFPVVFPPLNVGPKNPDNNVNWSVLTPIASSPGFYYKNRLPYSENYDLSLQRQFSANTLLTVSYVGTQGHRLLVTMEANPANPQACLALAPACGPGTESNFNVRLPVFGPLFGTNGYFIALGQSSYNSLQVNLRHTAGRLQLLAGYTYSKSLDNSSGYGEQVNFIRPKDSIALSAFNVTHNFVVSYSYDIPLDRLASNRLTKGWTWSGITRFATGIPITLIENDNNSLLGTQFTGPIPLGIDVPNYNGAGIHVLDPRKNKFQYFDTTPFSAEQIGQLGNSRRRFFHGPGINNWDMALLKDTKLTETLDLQFRAEFFNIFNHTQFQNVNGNISSASTFGFAQTAADPRITQFSLKLNF